jgi:hypothetical protein
VKLCAFELRLETEWKSEYKHSSSCDVPSGRNTSAGNKLLAAHSINVSDTFGTSLHKNSRIILQHNYRLHHP